MGMNGLSCVMFVVVYLSAVMVVVG